MFEDWERSAAELSYIFLCCLGIWMYASGGFRFSFIWDVVSDSFFLT